AVRAPAQTQRRGQVAALCADAGDQELGGRRRLPDRLQLLRGCRARDEAERARGGPGLSAPHDVNVEGLTIDQPVLEVCRAAVGRAGEHVDATILECQVGLYTVASLVRVDDDSVAAVDGEGGLGVQARGVRDVR